MENTTQPIQPITVADLNAICAIINLAATRGAFQGEELSQVGGIFDKIATFVNALVEQAKADGTYVEEPNNTSQGV